MTEQGQAPVKMETSLEHLFIKEENSEMADGSISSKRILGESHVNLSVRASDIMLKLGFVGAYKLDNAAMKGMEPENIKFCIQYMNTILDVMKESILGLPESIKTAYPKYGGFALGQFINKFKEDNGLALPALALIASLYKVELVRILNDLYSLMQALMASGVMDNFFATEELMVEFPPL